MPSLLTGFAVGSLPRDASKRNASEYIICLLVHDINSRYDDASCARYESDAAAPQRKRREHVLARDDYFTCVRLFFIAETKNVASTGQFHTFFKIFPAL